MGDLTDMAERPMLEGFLDFFRDGVVHKLDGLDAAAATSFPTPTGLTVLGVVKHLTWVEGIWFDHRMAGNPKSTVENADSFRVEPDDTVESLVAAYRAACAHSRAIAAEHQLDDRAVESHPLFGQVTLRWVYVHMVEETACHLGHQDILRELTDGSTG